MAKRASLVEVLDFANKVRAAGGGNPIDALMPAVPEATTECLIAKNLNFNCSVKGTEDYTAVGENRWVMELTDKAIRDRIADSLGLARRNYQPTWDDARYAVVLPEKIGQVAADFDSVYEAIALIVDIAERAFYDKRGYWPGCEDDRVFRDGENDEESFDAALRVAAKQAPKKDKRMIVELLPYVQGASEEARSIATLITEDGSIVL